mmetsp:Transcript_17849/g.54627  ORF Transcript_17849/g.54627 Transcript_17849/m.54627 type:complete len:239 (+) Transcript_17849:328-1044(+)
MRLATATSPWPASPSRRPRAAASAAASPTSSLTPSAKRSAQALPCSVSSSVSRSAGFTATMRSSKALLSPQPAYGSLAPVSLCRIQPSAAAAPGSRAPAGSARTGLWICTRLGCCMPIIQTAPSWPTQARWKPLAANHDMASSPAAPASASAGQAPGGMSTNRGSFSSSKMRKLSPMTFLSLRTCSPCCLPQTQSLLSSPPGAAAVTTALYACPAPMRSPSSCCSVGTMSGVVPSLSM